ncbi:MAG: hypothetical protein QOE58_386 [Actinomycetota bacterium]|nr:hypothetical protein [Actinomycetota bacterium]
MTIPLILAFAGLCLLLAITPGPDTFLVLRYSLTDVRFGLAAAAGSSIGSLFWAAMVAIGLAALIESSSAAFIAVKVMGGAYLIFLGVTGFRHRNDVGSTGLTPRAVPSGVGRALGAGLFSTVLNPKIGLFFLAIVPQFLPANAVNFGTTMILGLIDGVIAFFWLLLVSLASAKAVVWMKRPRVTQTVDCASSAILALLGIGTLATVI